MRDQQKILRAFEMIRHQILNRKLNTQHIFSSELYT